MPTEAGQERRSHWQGCNFKNWQVCFPGKISATLLLNAEQVNEPGAPWGILLDDVYP